MPSVDASNVLQFCRLCMCSDQDTKLFGEYHKSIEYANIASDLLNFMVIDDPGLPSKICMECTSNLILFYKFRQKCAESNAVYDTYRLKKTPACDSGVGPLYGTTEEDDDADNNSNVMRTEDETIEFLDQLYLETTHVEEEYLDASSSIDPEHISNSHESVEIAVPFEEGESELLIENDRLSPNIFKNDGLDEQNNTSIPSNSYLMDCSDGEADAAQEEGEIIVYLQTEDNIQEPSVKRNRTEVRSRECEECGKKFNRKSTLDQHRIGHTGVKDFTCVKCDAKFTRKSHLDCHLRIHINDRPHVCVDCDRAFVKSSDLVRHRRIHSEARNFQCPMCEKRFKRHADVHIHIRSHTGQKPYRCTKDPTTCEKSYTSHSSLKKHITKMHPPDAATNE